mgnify:CR=1 FL=1
MEKIIEPISRQLILDELTEDKFLRHSNKLQNQMYLVNAHNSPSILKEIGRLREEAFRLAGGGTGKSMDIDVYDTATKPFEQLIVWDPEDEEIIAGYRLKKCSEAELDANGNLETPTTHLFKISPNFYNNYLPLTLELGRSFVQPRYQRGGDSKKGLFSMDNLWDGLGAVVLQNTDIKYLFGKVTMYPQYPRAARNLILSFLNFYFPDTKELVRPIAPLTTEQELRLYQVSFEGLSFKEGYQILNKEVRALGTNIPPLINTYMNISGTMKTFGTALNLSFGEVEETGILVNTEDIFPSRKERHLDTYYENKQYIGPKVKWKG